MRIKAAGDTAFKTVDVIGDLHGYDYAHFSVPDGPCQVEVTATSLPSISAFSIAPAKNGIQGSVNGKVLSYAINGSQPTIVWVRGTNEKLVLAADSFVTPPNPADAHVFNVMGYPGVKNDRNDIGNTTNGFQAAIDAASAYSGSANGGRGIVYVPAGAYAVGNITLKPKMELFLAEGSALFYASNVAGDIWNYTYLTDWTTKGNGTRWFTTQDDASNIKIWGRGTIDGNAMGAGGFSSNLLVLNHNHHVAIDGIILKSGSKWGTLIGKSDDVTIHEVKFFQHMDGVGEDDALDIIESQNVTVSSSLGFSFDDSFSVKTYSGTEAYVAFGGAHQAASNIVFDDVLAWTGCHALKIGQGAMQTIENVTFRNSVVYNSAHAVSLHHKAGTATVQNVTWDGIDVEHVENTNLGRSWAYFNIESTGTGPGPIRNITVKSIRLRDLGTDASPIDGFDGTRNIDGLSFRDIYIDTTSTGAGGSGFYAQNAADAHLARNAFVSNLQVSQDGVRLFWDRDAVKVDGAADWSPGNFKGDCGPGEALTGLSQMGGAALEGPHALRCKAYGTPFGGTLAAAPAISVSGDASRAASPHAKYDWDPGYAKNECGNVEYVSGLSQDASHALKQMRCASASISIAGNACNSKSVSGADDRGESTGEWDSGFVKAECSADMVVVGVSVNASGKPRRILCCHK